jgi:hypothetical protein
MFDQKAAGPVTANDEPRECDQLGSEIASSKHQAQIQDGASTGGDPFYGASYIKPKRHRRLKSQIIGIKDAIKEILEADHPQTVRQVFYALTVRGQIAKIELEYQRTVVRLLGDMREAGEICFEWIADHTRPMRKPSSFTGVEHCLTSAAEFYRRNLWHSAPVYVEVWVEKDALAGVILEETKVYDVPLMVARGYSSISFLHSAAKAIKANGKPAHIYHFGDLDPSGVDAARDIEAGRDLPSWGCQYGQAVFIGFA